jgi:hypothetical protein
MNVSCECCVLSGRGLCVGLVTRLEESYRAWCVWVWSWSFENWDGLGPPRGCRAIEKKNCRNLFWGWHCARCQYRKVRSDLDCISSFFSFAYYCYLKDERANVSEAV